MSITEKQTEHGIYWRSELPPDEPDETWRWARGVACLVAETEAIKTRRNHVVAVTLGTLSVTVMALGDPGLSEGGLVPMYEITPDSLCIKHGVWPERRAIN